MTVYEVNIKISNEIYEEYVIWLKEHIAEMLELPYFEKAQLLKNTEANEFTVHYYLASAERLDEYVEKEAPKMRQRFPEKFVGSFEISRRVLEVYQ